MVVSRREEGRKEEGDLHMAFDVTGSDQKYIVAKNIMSRIAI